MSPEQYLQHEKKRLAQERSKAAPVITDIAVVGLDEAGFRLAQHAALRGHRVLGFDEDDVRVAQLLPTAHHHLSFSSERRSLTGLGAYLIAAPVHIRNAIADYGPLKSACETVGHSLAAGALVCIDTAVEPGVSERVCLPILEKASGLTRHQFDFAHVPSREPSSDDAWQLENTPRVLGALTEAASNRAYALYDALIDAEILVLPSIKEAEAVALLERAFLDVNAALVNELAIALHDAGIDTKRVIDGAATKPYDFLPRYPGFAEPQSTADPYRALRRERRSGYEHRFLTAAHKTNRAMPAYLVRTLTDALRERRIRQKSALIALLGLSNDSNTSALRETAELIRKKSMRVRLFDPLNPVRSSVQSLDEAFEGADAALILGARDEFQALTPRDFERHNVTIVIDGINCFEKERFEDSRILYRGMGRQVIR